MEPTNTKTYRVSEVAEILACTPETVYALIKSGRLRATRLARSWRVTQQAINEFLGE